MAATSTAGPIIAVRHSPVYLTIKRALDILTSSAGLLFLAPLLPFLALLIKIDSEGPVFFKQQRLGKGGALFTIYKLRTMTDRAPEIRNPDGSKFVGENDPRLTRVGRVLRDYSIDELPQLFNILRGDMSVIGPRPDQPGPNLSGEIFQKKRLMKPGLTSLATVGGRNSIPWPRRVALDAEYVERASLALDFQILLRTVSIVLRREGIYYDSRR